MLDMAQGNTLRFGPFHQFAADILGSVIHTNGERCAASFDDLVQAADDAFRRQQKVHLNAKPSRFKVVQNKQQSELPTIHLPVSNEIHGPDNVRRIWHG